MSGSNDLQQRMLEQATGPEPAAAADAESARLREAWLALGQLLEAGGADDGPHLEFSAAPRRRQRGRWLVPLAGLVAASLLLAAGVSWVKWPTHQPNTDLARAQQPAAGSQQPVAGSGTLASTEQPAAGSQQPVAGTWDDSLDSEITEVEQQLVETEQQWSSRADAFEVAQYTVEWAQYDFDSSQL